VEGQVFLQFFLIIKQFWRHETVQIIGVLDLHQQRDDVFGVPFSQASTHDILIVGGKVRSIRLGQKDRIKQRVKHVDQTNSKGAESLVYFEDQ